MAKLHFETLTFREDKIVVNIDLLKSWSAEISKEELVEAGFLRVIDPHTIEFSGADMKKAELKFSFILDKCFGRLKTRLTGNPATYIHRNSGIPLIGNVAFGIIYRNSSIVEIKTNTACNINCVYCSISEGLSSRKNDFVVEKDYLLEELEKLIKFVGENVEVHIGVQGEPFLYGDMENLIKDLQEIKRVYKISVDTNGVLLSRESLDRLGRCDKLQLNFSLDAVHDALARKIAGIGNYNVKHVMEMIEYASAKNIKIVVAPVMVKGINDKEMEKVIAFIKSLDPQPVLGIQNFLLYKTGRNPAKAMGWKEFYELLGSWEKKYGLQLRLNKDFFNVHKTQELPKPFVEGDIIKAVIKCPDRFPNTVIAVAGGREINNQRSISVPDCEYKKNKLIKVKITRDKHNIFVGKLV